jgi:hypothetical protein
MKIGIDIGNVIIGGGGEDTFFTEKFLETPEVVGAKSSIGSLWAGGHEVHLISKCGEKVETKSLDWLEFHAFTPSYVLLYHRIHFVRKRHLKAPMAQALELDIFIDDRQDIIDSMEGVVPHRILFTSWEQTNKELEEIFKS